MNESTHSANVDLDFSIQRLRAARRKLKNISSSELNNLPPEKKKAWAESLQQLSVAIGKLETADLEHLNDEFTAREPQLQAVSAKLKDDLAQLSDAVAMIDVASTTLKTVTEIVALLA